MIKISEINIYPIKSCRGTALQSCSVTPRGFQFDRQWLVVEPDGEFLTQRTWPRMSQILPSVRTTNGDSKQENVIVMDLSAPDMPPLTVRSRGIGREMQVRVWDSTCQATDEGDEAAEWFSRYLGTECRLVRFADNFVRPVDEDYARLQSDQVGFADGFPYLLISEASLVDLNAKLSNALPMNRFRPNIVVAGCSAFAEDDWSEFTVGELKFFPVKPCSRCVITCTDQDKSTVSAEPLKTLANYRRVDNKIMFGQNLVHEGSGQVSVGDVVHLPTTAGEPAG